MVIDKHIGFTDDPGGLESEQFRVARTGTDQKDTAGRK
jgi:hypothetical protein